MFNYDLSENSAATFTDISQRAIFLRDSAPDSVHLILLAPRKVGAKKGAPRKSLHAPLGLRQGRR